MNRCYLMGHKWKLKHPEPINEEYGQIKIKFECRRCFKETFTNGEKTESLIKYIWPGGRDEPKSI